MSPLSKMEGETGILESDLKGVQNPAIKGRIEEHDITLDMVSQVQNKVRDSERALIMTEINNEEIKLITNSECFKAISEEVLKFKVGDEIKCEVAVARVTDQHYHNDKNGPTFMVKTEFRVTVKKMICVKSEDIMYMNKMLKNIKEKYNQKHKLQEKKKKCDICGSMLLNSTGLNLH